MARVDAVSASHAALTIAHIVPAAALVVLAAFVLLRTRQNKSIELAFSFSALLPD
jgi:hypothetical protein